jgi:thioredoxin 1
METNPFGKRPDLEQLADEAVEELVASGAFSTYSGRLPPRAKQKLRRSKLRLDDESLLEDIFSERMIALTRNAYVEEVGDEDLNEKVLALSYDRPVMADIYSNYCRPCNHILPIVYQLAEQYRDELKVVKINVSTNARFRELFLGPVQMTPAFLFFRDGRPVRASGRRLARLLGQTAFITSTRAGLEKRIRSVLDMSFERSSASEQD